MLRYGLGIIIYISNIIKITRQLSFHIRDINFVNETKKNFTFIETRITEALKSLKIQPPSHKKTTGMCHETIGNGFLVKF